MSNKFVFNRNVDGDPDLSNLAGIRAHLRDPESKQLTVSREIRALAESKIVAMTRELSYMTSRPFVEALREVQHREPELFLLSRSPVDMQRFATVVAVVRE